MSADPNDPTVSAGLGVREGASREYVLIQDDDCHWYVCPADKRDEAEAYFEACLDEAADSFPEAPPWLDRVGGAPSRVRFTGYVIG